MRVQVNTDITLYGSVTMVTDITLYGSVTMVTDITLYGSVTMVTDLSNQVNNQCVPPPQVNTDKMSMFHRFRMIKT